MPVWSEKLDQIVAGTNEPKPPHVVALDLPRPQGWLPGRVWAHWVVDPRMFHLGGAVFGGYLAALADQALGLATMTVLDEGEVFTTSDLRVSFFRPVARGSLHIEANVVHRGHGMVQTEVVFTRDDGKIAGKATATQVVTRPPAVAGKPVAVATVKPRA
jgi:uncharacterized protein (TIGR00369 family)